MTIAYVLRIARKSLFARKTRTLVTVGGIVIGVAAIVFLVSLGYGLQQLVTTQVAQLDALTMTEVHSEKPSTLKITDETLRTFKGIDGVAEAAPLVNVAGKVEYQGSSTDCVIFGAPVEYLKLNSFHPTGKYFTDTGLTKNKTYSYKVRAYKTVNGEKIYGKFTAVKSAKPY